MPEIVTLIIFIVSLLVFAGVMFVAVISAIKSAKQTKEIERHMKK